MLEKLIPAGAGLLIYLQSYSTTCWCVPSGTTYLTAFPDCIPQTPQPQIIFSSRINKEMCVTLLECDPRTDCVSFYDTSVILKMHTCHDQKYLTWEWWFILCPTVNQLTLIHVYPVTSQIPSQSARLHSGFWWTCWWRTREPCTLSSSRYCRLLRAEEKTTVTWWSTREQTPLSACYWPML